MAHYMGRNVRKRTFGYMLQAKIQVSMRIRAFTGRILDNQKIDFDISRKLSANETSCMKYQSLFCGENEKVIIILLFALRVLRVN